MSQDNVALVKRIYEAFGAGDVPAVFGAMSGDIVWNEAENFPLADRNPYVGPDAIVQGVFARLGSDWEGFTVVPEEYLDAGDTVVMLGRYRGTCRATGRPVNAQLAHIWRIESGKAKDFRQLTDTLQFALATATE